MNKQLRTVLERLDGVRETSRGYQARCPAHDDHDPSLSIGEGDHQPVLLHCWAGCTSEEVVAALGLDWSHICEGKAEPRDGEDANTLSAVQRERQKRKRRLANIKAKLRRAERAKEKMCPSERLLFRLCCTTGHNCEETTEMKKAQRKELIHRAIDR